MAVEVVASYSRTKLSLVAFWLSISHFLREITIKVSLDLNTVNESYSDR